MVQGNFIGTNAAGTAALANQGDGVWLDDAFGDTIGGTAAGAGNLISGNNGSGVDLESGSSNLLVANTIGGDAAANPLPNYGDGGFVSASHLT